MGDGSVRCWGRNAAGELGDGGGSGEQLKPVQVPGVRDVTQIGLGAGFSCAVTGDKHVTCWGTGRILGDGKRYENLKPTRVGVVDDVAEIAVSGVLVCARTNKGGVTCWGTEKPVRVDGASAAEVAVASTHVCTRTAAGAVSCTGDTLWSKPGPDGFSSPGVSGAEQIVTGDGFACALGKGGKVSCWGRNEMGQLGRAPDMDSHATAVDVPGLGSVKKLSAGETQTCALDASGGVTCWGNNSEGELGIGKTSSDERPTKVSGLSNVVELCLASIHGCARTSGNDVLCWGTNTSGQLGDGTKEPRYAPTRVAW